MSHPISRQGVLTRIATTAKFRRFKRDESGLAMTEFAIIAPFLITAWLGATTFADLQTVSNRTSRVAATVSDIIAQGETVSQARADAAFSAADAILGPGVAAGMNLFVAGLEIQADGRPVVKWSFAYKGGSKPQVGQTYAINGSTNVTLRNDFVVTAEAKVQHEPVFASALTGSQLYEYDAYNVPRNGREIKVE